MPPTAAILIDGVPRDAPGARDEGDDLWVPVEALEGVSGWSLKPEGACRGEVCVPLPVGQEEEFLRGGAFNLAWLARRLDQPVVHDTAQAAWVIGEAAATRTSALRSLEAPNFTLPDMTGRMHSLAEHRGKKVFLASWASW